MYTHNSLNSIRVKNTYRINIFKIKKTSKDFTSQKQGDNNPPS